MQKMRKASYNLNTSSLVRSGIEKGGERLWRMEDFRDQPLPAVAQAFSRIKRKGTLERLSRGLLPPAADGVRSQPAQSYGDPTVRTTFKKNLSVWIIGREPARFQHASL